MQRETTQHHNLQFAAVMRIAGTLLAIVAFICATTVLTAPQDTLTRADEMRLCARAGDTNAVEALLNKGVPVDAADPYGFTALAEASRAGHDQCVERLLRAGANVNACAPLTGTALIQASINRRVSTMKILLEHGAVPEMCGVDGHVPLFWAMTFEDQEMIDLLRRYGAKSRT